VIGIHRFGSEGQSEIWPFAWDVMVMVVAVVGYVVAMMMMMRHLDQEWERARLIVMVVALANSAVWVRMAR
jgi:hypothetical protein